MMCACSQDLPMERYVHDVSGHSDKISIEEALQNAEQIFTDLDGSTRSKVRNVKSIKAFASCANTRSDMGGRHVVLCD